MDKGEKVLCYCGMNHAFTKYRQPIVIDEEFIRLGDIRCGNYLYEMAKDTVFMILLHDIRHPQKDMKVLRFYLLMV